MAMETVFQLWESMSLRSKSGDTQTGKWWMLQCIWKERTPQTKHELLVRPWIAFEEEQEAIRSFPRTENLGDCQWPYKQSIPKELRSESSWSMAWHTQPLPQVWTVTSYWLFAQLLLQANMHLYISRDQSLHLMLFLHLHDSLLLPSSL